METKKNPKKDLSKSSGVFFAAGMVMVLALTYVALEWKTFYQDYEGETVGILLKDNITEKPIIVNLPPPPPPPAIDPPILDVVPNEDDRSETDIIVSEPTMDNIITIDSITYIEPDEDIPIHITAVEVVPIFPGCESSTDKIACFNKMIYKHIRKNFRYPEAEQELGIQGRVSIMFEIQKDGNIGNVRMRGPNKNLEKEAARIIDKLPQMTPGKQGGKNVRVPFSIPITFKLQ